MRRQGEFSAIAFRRADLAPRSGLQRCGLLRSCRIIIKVAI